MIADSGFFRKRVVAFRMVPTRTNGESELGAIAMHCANFESGPATPYIFFFVRVLYTKHAPDWPTTPRRGTSRSLAPVPQDIPSTFFSFFFVASSC